MALMSDGVPADVDTAAPRRDMSLFGLAAFCLRHRTVLVLVPAITFILAVGLNMMRARTWTTVTSFVPQSRTLEPGGIAGLAAQFGVSLGAGQPAHSPAFYAELVRSRAVLADLAGRQFPTRDGPRTFEQLYGIDKGTAERRQQEAIEELRERIWASPSRETGIVTVGVKLKDPVMSHAMSARIFEILNEFNLVTRQSQARAEREFAEARLKEVRTELAQAEQRLETFQRSNRSWENSPELRSDQDRLSRAVTSRQQLVEALQQRFEQARLDEVRDVPVITMIEKPVLAAKPDGRGTVVRGIFALLLGGFLALMIAFVRELAMRAHREQSADYAQFVHLRREALAGLRRRQTEPR